MDRFREIEVFTMVIDRGGYTGAAEKLGISKSSVSRHVSRLEDRLGARLLDRTTRSVSPTDIGLMYYERARDALDVAAEAEARVTSMQADLSGTLRVSVATDFGVHHLAPLVGRFLKQHPGISLDMELENRCVDLDAEGFDMVIRVGSLSDSSLRARKIGETQLRLIASPAYLQTFGRPDRIDDLQDHQLLHLSGGPSPAVWKLTAPTGEHRQIRVAGRLSVNDGQALLSAAINGLGIAYLPDFVYAEAIREGLVVDVLPALPVAPVGIYAVYPPGRFVPPKVRAFIDFLVESFPIRLRQG